MRFIYRLAILTAALIAAGQPGSAQSSTREDTIRIDDKKLLTPKSESIKHSYAVFFTDSIGNRVGSTDIWDRELNRIETPNGKTEYAFEWKWYRGDSLASISRGRLEFPSLRAIEYQTSTRTVPGLKVNYSSDAIQIAAKSRSTGNDTSFTVKPVYPAYTFPMDLEVFAMLPFKFVGQTFIIPFYEPGTAAANYYKYVVTAKEDIEITPGARISCWQLRIDYPGVNSFAKFWIADVSREVIKMQECFRGRYRYKVKLY